MTIASTWARIFRQTQNRQRRPDDAVALQRYRASHLERADTDWLSTLARVRNCLGNQTGWQKECGCHDSRRCGHAPRRFFRSGLFRQRKKLAGAVHCRRQRLRDQQSDPKNKSAARSVFSSLTNGWSSPAKTFRDLRCGGGSDGKNARRRRTAFLVGKNGAPLQPHQLRRPQTLS